MVAAINVDGLPDALTTTNNEIAVILRIVTPASFRYGPKQKDTNLKTLQNVIKYLENVTKS